MELNILQKKVDDWIKKYGVRYFNELTNMAQLTEEVGEVARIISRVYGEQSPKKNEKINDLGEELADVLFVLICLANQTEVDLEKAFDEKLKKKTKRDIDRHLSNDKLK
jgi:NTP pyrophosphatase (non-canonical NTP hydrolase)